MTKFKADCAVMPETDHLEIAFNEALGQIEIVIRDDDLTDSVSVFLDRDNSKALLNFLKECME